jgi:glycosyltransferase involved in cell wall biosynthesis
MKILFLTDNFPPEVNAPATRTFEHCSEWVKLGHEITVITCAPNFPDGKVFTGYRNVKAREIINGIKVIRVKTYITANEGFYKRTLDYISFGITSFFAGISIKTDIIIGTSPQFFTAVSARYLSFFKRRPWIMEVRDLWPESIKSVGAIKDSPVLRFLSWLELRLYKSANKIITVTDAFKARIIERGIDPNKIEVIKNGANLKLFTPAPKNDKLLKELGLTGKFIFGFIGTIGMAHKLDFIIKSAQRINDPDIHFLFIGAGAEKKNLDTMVEEGQIKNVTILGMIPKNSVPDYLSIIDCTLINLKRSETFKTVIPSKIFESAAMGKPILLGVDGEARSIVEGYSAGLFFEPENEDDLIAKIKVLKSDKSLYHKLKNGGLTLALEFDRIKLAKAMIEIIQAQVRFK